MNVGTGRGGSTGLDPPSKVELVENAGDPGCSGGWESILADPSSAGAGGGEEINEDVVSRAMRPAQTILKSSATVSLRKWIEAQRGAGCGVVCRRVRSMIEGKDGAN